MMLRLLSRIVLVYGILPRLQNTEEQIFLDTNRDNYLVLGHPVMIGDILEWYDFEGTEFALLEIWKLKRLPIDEQSSEAIDYIYSLI